MKLFILTNFPLIIHSSRYRWTGNCPESVSHPVCEEISKWTWQSSLDSLNAVYTKEIEGKNIVLYHQLNRSREWVYSELQSFGASPLIEKISTLLARWDFYWPLRTTTLVFESSSRLFNRTTHSYELTDKWSPRETAFHHNIEFVPISIQDKSGLNKSSTIMDTWEKGLIGFQTRQFLKLADARYLCWVEGTNFRWLKWWKPHK